MNNNFISVIDDSMFSIFLLRCLYLDMSCRSDSISIQFIFLLIISYKLETPSLYHYQILGMTASIWWLSQIVQDIWSKCRSRNYGEISHFYLLSDRWNTYHMQSEADHFFQYKEVNLYISLQHFYRYLNMLFNLFI